MTTAEIGEFLRANIDKTILVKYKNGETDLALVLTVDDEGFVYDLGSLKPEDRETEYWTPFSEIEDVQPVNPSN